MCITLTCTLFNSCKQKLKLLLKRLEVTCCMTQMTTLWFVYSESTKSKNLILNMCLHENHNAHKL